MNQRGWPLFLPLVHPHFGCPGPSHPCPPASRADMAQFDSLCQPPGQGRTPPLRRARCAASLASTKLQRLPPAGRSRQQILQRPPPDGGRVAPDGQIRRFPPLARLGQSSYDTHLAHMPATQSGRIRYETLLTALLLPLLPLAVQAAEPVWITVGADSGVELKQVKARLAPVQRQRRPGPAGPGRGERAWHPLPPDARRHQRCGGYVVHSTWPTPCRAWPNPSARTCSAPRR